MIVTIQFERKRNNNLLKSMKQLEDMTARVGWFEEATHRKGGSLAQIASVHEYGKTFSIAKTKATITIPPRPFMRPCIEENNQKWQKLFDSAFVQDVATGLHPLSRAFQKVKIQMVQDLKSSIQNVDGDPLKESTIKQRNAHGNKQDSRLLIDYGDMLRGICGKVEKGAPA